MGILNRSIRVPLPLWHIYAIVITGQNLLLSKSKTKTSCQNGLKPMPKFLKKPIMPLQILESWVDWMDGPMPHFARTGVKP